MSTCETCNKVFKKSAFTAHQNRKTPCKAPNEKAPKQSKPELIALCKERGIKCSGKSKEVLIELLKNEVKPNESIKPIENENRLRMIDLFAGTGAFTHAFKGVSCVFANDMVEWSKRIYDANHHSLTLQDLNEVKVEDIPSHDIMTGGFPCFIAGTNVLTNNGYKHIEDVVMTDTLLTHKGRFQPILNLQRKTDATQLCAVEIIYRPTIRCTPEHPFYARLRTETIHNRVHVFSYSDPKWIPAHKLTADHFVGMPINTDEILLTNCDTTGQIPEDIQTAPCEVIYEFLSGLQSETPEILLGKERLLFKLDYMKNGGHTNSNVVVEDGYVWFNVKSTNNESVAPQTVYNFEVAEDNSYCVENVIVHNCQPFSIAGKQEGFNDVRSNVFWKILEIIDHHEPRAIILENVKNLVSHDEGRTFKTIISNLESRGYHIRTRVLNTAEITGIPQHRERIYIVCLKDKAVFDAFTLDFPEIEKRGIQELLEPKVAQKYYYTDASATWALVSEGVTKKDTIYQYRRVYVRENKSNECPTLTANMGTGGHNVPLVRDDHGIRKLTPRECFNFQGFPSSYILPAISDCNLYKLAGNAVSLPVVKLIADRLIPLL